MNAQTPLSAKQVSPGSPYPLGATVDADGINFSIFSHHATSIDLLLFERYDQAEPSAVISLDAPEHRSFYYWHAHVGDVGDGLIYAYRIRGPYTPEKGMRYNPNKILLDPYAQVVAYGTNWSRSEAYGFSDNTLSGLKAVAVDLHRYDWQGDQPLSHPNDGAIIYETHVASLTAHPSAKSECPGTYKGLIDQVPYLKSLGITAVELLPVQQFDEQEVDAHNPTTGEKLKNYWGYAPIAFFAPHQGYSCSNDPRAVVDEFRDMVRALHQAGIQVILDVVFNHTAESDETGPTISFRGIENVGYYMLKRNQRYYQNYAGTGNVVNCNHSIVRRLIRQCLRYWVREFHIDGFRFDLASVLSRDEDGQPLKGAPILWEIESDPVLANTRLIAEAWDAAGLYQLGSFTGDRWTEWNGRFRDDVRRFIRGDNNTVRDFAWRMAGSFDIFSEKPSYASHRSINYVTCHDGFTLNDLVSYRVKHNKANGEDNLDGMNENLSDNYGAEGSTDDASILALRNRQMKNLLAVLLLARGTPMLLGGDELGRTQQGNNNAYCQDNATSWYDWTLVEKNANLLRFVREMIALRRRHPTLYADRKLGDRPYEQMLVEGIDYHGVKLNTPDWSEKSHSLAMHLHAVGDDQALFVIANSYWEPLTFQLPPNHSWKRIVDTSKEAPEDIVAETEALIEATESYRVLGRSVVVFIEA